MDLIDIDPWLEPHRNVIEFRKNYVEKTTKKLLGGSSLADFALGFHYFGLHKSDKSWVFREWAPNATRIFLVGSFNDWQELPEFELKKGNLGEWSGEFELDTIKHGDKYKLKISWPGGEGYRIPSYANRVVQTADSVDFETEVWSPAEPYQWKNTAPKPPEVPLIYEAHVGMSSEKPAVSNFKDFSKNILPRIKKAGYNTIQLMAIQEHPYYGSFGYHVSNFFAVSSRFGTPDDFKLLVDTAHGMGLRVIMDIVHSHAVKNELEGLSRFDGTLDQYFYPGERGDHPAWDSRVFDYGKSQVLHFLLSNCRYWLDEYHLDGFRFDGVTSMLYTDHGLEKSFTSYDDYYGDNLDKDAFTYLTLANQLIHDVNPNALTVAEEMSGLPGIAGRLDQGGVGFDYRLAMGTPDLWIKTLKEQKDEEWDLGSLVHTIHSHRPEEKVINYAESHDQALVGDKTLIFRLIDKEMYWHMQKADDNLIVERGVALHKMIRLLTASLHGGGYLNFMGNEFGHPEWIDFPREGNNWSFAHARRQWSLVDDDLLKYQYLGEFDKVMTTAISKLTDPGLHYLEINSDQRIISYFRSDFLFVFNFSPSISVTDHFIPCPASSYEVAFSSDDSIFGGQQRIDHNISYLSRRNNGQEGIKVYCPARTALVLQKKD